MISLSLVFLLYNNISFIFLHVMNAQKILLEDEINHKITESDTRYLSYFIGEG